MNVNAENVGKASSDKEGNNLPENAGFAFRTEDVLDSNPILTDWYWQVENTGAGFDVDFNVTSNNNYSEGNVMYDPANRIDAQFKLADTKTNFDNNNFYASDTSPQFDDINHPDQQRVLSSNNAIDFYLQVEDQSGTLADAVFLASPSGMDTLPDTTEDLLQQSAAGLANYADAQDLWPGL